MFSFIDWIKTFFCFLRHGEAGAVHRGGETDAGGEHAPAEEAAAGDGEERSSVQAAEREREQFGDG